MAVETPTCMPSIFEGLWMWNFILSWR